MKSLLRNLQQKKSAYRLKPVIFVGGCLIVLLFGGFGSWAAIASIAGAVVASGVVTVDSNRKTVQHLEGGIVSELLVRDGDEVQKGQLLVRLDDTRASANLGIIASQLDTFEARLSRLLAESNSSVKILFSEGLLLRRDDKAVQDILERQEALFQARQASLKGQVSLLEQRIAQFKEQIRGLEAQEKSKAKQRELLVQELTGIRKLYEKGHAPITRVLELERAAEAMKGERGHHIASIAQAEKGIGETELEILQIQKTFREEVEAELIDVQSEVFNLQEQKVAALDEHNRIEVRAPRAGKVVGMNVHTVGGVVSAGQAILDIVPKEDKLIVEARVEPQHVDKVLIGLSANVRLSAFDMRTTPEVTGHVIAVSADRFTDEATGLSYYLARVEIPEEELEKLGGLALLPGMPAEVFILTGDRTALSYLVKPLSDSIMRAFREE